jgi:hypothetical protein
MSSCHEIAPIESCLRRFVVEGHAGIVVDLEAAR